VVGFTGADCSVVADLPPIVRQLVSAPICNMRDSVCNHVRVVAENFDMRTPITCKLVRARLGKLGNTHQCHWGHSVYFLHHVASETLLLLLHLPFSSRVSLYTRVDLYLRYICLFFFFSFYTSYVTMLFPYFKDCLLQKIHLKITRNIR